MNWIIHCACQLWRNIAFGCWLGLRHKAWLKTYGVCLECGKVRR